MPQPPGKSGFLLELGRSDHDSLELVITIVWNAQSWEVPPLLPRTMLTILVEPCYRAYSEARQLYLPYTMPPSAVGRHVDQRTIVDCCTH